MDNRILHDQIQIDSEKVKEFFRNRENKELPHRYNYVNYQDLNPELAVSRDVEEKRRVSRYLPFRENDYVLDIGCGVGRWGDYIAPIVSNGKYVGIDYVDFFLDLARDNFKKNSNTAFYNGSFQEVKNVLKRNDEFREYDKILLNGILMYINESDIDGCLTTVNQLLRDDGFIYIKESVSVNERLTLNGFYSNELDAEYSVIYRSLKEYTDIITNHFLNKKYTLITCQPTWDEKVDYSKETSNWFWILRKNFA